MKFVTTFQNFLPELSTTYAPAVGISFFAVVGLISLLPSLMSRHKLMDRFVSFMKKFGVYKVSK